MCDSPLLTGIAETGEEEGRLWALGDFLAG